MSASLAILICRILVVAIFPVSAIFKILKWPAFVTVLTQAGAPYPKEMAMVGTAAELILPSLVILGLFTRLSLVGLIVFTIVATAIAHRFWTYPEAQQFAQMINFLKNVGLIGGMALVASIGSGRYALKPS